MLKAFFLPAESGKRFCIFHGPVAGASGYGFVYAHPFGEEMNKARRMAALHSRRLAAAGHSVLLIDLFGCGDSSGDFVDASWEIWKRDLRIGLDWLRSQTNARLGLWGLRLGATLAADVARDPAAGIEQLVLWQPVVSGEQFLTQFLRLRLAAEMLSDGAARSGMGELRDALARGESLEIAGYDLHPRLAAEIGALSLADLVPAVKHVHCLEISVAAEPKLLPPSQRAIGAWQSKGLAVSAKAVKGEPFWSTMEITECEPLLSATEESLKGAP